MYIALKNPFRYRSYYYDTETGLYYLNSRYYDPETGRFINVDDISIINESNDLLNGLNLFIYCSNNPVMLTDKNGQSWWDDLWQKIRNGWDIIIGTIASVVLVGVGLLLTIGSAGALYNIGATLIGAGIGGLLGGLTNKQNGGSFWSGFLGGVISGALTGLGISLGPIGAFIGGSLGNLFGTITIDAINGVKDINSNYFFSLLAESLLYGLVSIGSWKFGDTTKLLNSMGFTNIFATMLIWTEFASATIYEGAKNFVEQIAQIFRKMISWRI